MTEKFTKTLLQCDQPTANGRIYPKNVIENAITKAKQPLLGTLGMSNDIAISFDKVAYQVTNLQVNQYGELTGDIEILKTPCGEDLKKIIENPYLAFRTVGIGSIDENHIIQKDFTFTSIGAVFYPAIMVKGITETTNKMIEKFEQWNKKSKRKFTMTTFLSPNEIVDDILNKQFSAETIKDFKAIPENELIMLHHGLGMWIRNHYGLWEKENPYIDGSDAMGDKFPDQVSQAIIVKMWRMVNTLEKYK